ncbi:MAG: protein arginine kinase [Gemmatales bacterium]|nr:protein arginine kinase [Gemmatales bacterium]MDW7994445.1 protein arginine kinase [Gemmatales bacterium]
MRLDDLLHSTGEWLRGEGPESDVVVSTRVRLARNLADFPFPNRASALQCGEIESLLRERLQQLSETWQLTYWPLHRLSDLDRQFLVERQLISREHAHANGQRGVAIREGETISVMINEEDHLRMQAIRSGLQLDEAWREINRLDDELSERVCYAFSEEYGYLTACPTNVGTGMRASVLLHLPALTLTKQMEKLLRALQKMNLAVRGLYGEGTRASGDLYQISNQVTLGRSEEEILRSIRECVSDIVAWERNVRELLLREMRSGLLDRVHRSLGTLRSARMMSADETLELLSSVRLGVILGLLDDLTVPRVNALLLQTRPAHLQKIHGESLDSEEQDAVRARYLRAQLRHVQLN